MSVSRWVIPFFFLLFIVFVVFSTLDLGQQRCEVCIEFKGSQACRTAAGPTRDEAVRTAQDNACAQLTSGMSEVRACGAVEPLSINCQD